MNLLISLHKTRKYLLINLSAFLVFITIYSMLDINSNGTYRSMIESFGMLTVSLHVLLNIVISLLSSVVITWSYISLSVNKKDVVSTNIPFLGVLVGFFTFGCTPCVVALLSIFGVSFAPLILPNANLMWKVLVLLLVIVSVIVTIKSFNKGCKIEENNT